MDNNDAIALEEAPNSNSLRVGFNPTGARLALNTVLNLSGQVLPLLAGVFLIPYIIRSLGPDRFGVLGIVWLTSGYFSLFDFGLGRATTKYLAEWLAKGETSHVSEMVWTSIGIQILLGVAGGVALLVLTPRLVGKIFKIPASLASESRTTFIILALTLPLVLATSGLRAVLEGCQRFGLTNLLRIPMTTLAFALPAIAIPFGVHLPGIVFLLAILRLTFAIAHLWLCFRALACLRSWPSFSATTVWPLLSFGGWVTVSNLVNPILLSVDRFLIGSLVSMAMVGYYTAPMEAVSKLWIIPASLTTAAFPICGAFGPARKQELDILYARSTKFLFLVLAPISFTLFLLSHQITQLWLGPDFVAKSGPVLQILALGVFVNCFAHVPYCFIQGLGRPDAAAKLLLVELVPYAALAWWMIQHHGIMGAATAWSIRVAIEVLLLMGIAWCLFGLSVRRTFTRRTLGAVLALGTMGLAMICTRAILPGSPLAAISICSVWVAAFALTVWKYVLDDMERGGMMILINRLRNIAITLEVT